MVKLGGEVLFLFGKSNVSGHIVHKQHDAWTNLVIALSGDHIMHEMARFDCCNTIRSENAMQPWIV